MQVNLNGESFKEYPALTGKQKIHVQWLMYDYYRLAWYEIRKEFASDEECPFTILEMLYMDRKDMEREEEFELCQLLTDTIENSEYFSKHSIRRYRVDDKKDL